MADSAGGGAATMGYDSKIALTPLAVDFHEPTFLTELNAENAFTAQYGFWFQLSNEEKQQAKYPFGPLNPQALNRYAYGLNNPVKYTDPTGHFWETIFDVAMVALDIHFIIQEGWTPANTAALVLDVICAVVPVLPAGGGLAIHGTTAALKLAEVGVRVPAVIRAGQAATKILQFAKSPNQIDVEIKTGKAPRGIEHVHTPKIPGEQLHIHFDDGAALNVDGTWKHGSTNLTKAIIKWLSQHGWKLPTK